MSTHLPPLQPMESSVFEGHHYDPHTRTLTVKFKSGGVWTYDDVPAERAEAFAGARSAGSYFASRIKGQYAGRKL